MPNSRERAAAAETAWRKSGPKPAIAAEHVERGFGGAPGRSDLLAQIAGGFAGLRHQRAGAGDGAAGQPHGGVAVEAFLFSRGREHFGEQEDISRARAGDGGDHIHQALGRDRFDRAQRLQQLLDQFAIVGACIRARTHKR